MLAKATTPLLFLVSIGCGVRPAASAKDAKPRSAPLAAVAGAHEGASRPAGDASPVVTSSRASTDAPRTHAAQLGLSLGPLDEERQIAALREAILLYTQFLERAAGRPELEPAVRKSRERIEDARATIVFLEAGLEAKRNADQDR